nr:hypothetical protein HK105_005579 [Polyrhizophydium stewartii]
MAQPPVDIAAQCASAAQLLAAFNVSAPFESDPARRAQGTRCCYGSAGDGDAGTMPESGVPAKEQGGFFGCKADAAGRISIEAIHINQQDITSLCSVKTWPPLDAFASVKSLVMPQNELALPVLSGVSTLITLKKLDLSHNAIMGRIPSPLFSLANLGSLDLSYNLISSPLPAEIAATKLTSLDLYGNLFNDEMPDMHALQLMSCRLDTGMCYKRYSDVPVACNASGVRPCSDPSRPVPGSSGVPLPGRGGAPGIGGVGSGGAGSAWTTGAAVAAGIVGGLVLLVAVMGIVAVLHARRRPLPWPRASGGPGELFDIDGDSPRGGGIRDGLRRIFVIGRRQDRGAFRAAGMRGWRPLGDGDRDSGGGGGRGAGSGPAALGPLDSSTLFVLEDLVPLEPLEPLGPAAGGPAAAGASVKCIH